MSTILHLAAAPAPAGEEQWADRRDALRFQISPETSAHLVAAVGEASWPARVLNVSTEGISLNVRCRFEPGLTVPLELANGVRVFCCALQLRIVHAAEQPDGSFLVGGDFDRRLTARELIAILS
jgi:hypothetical protein